MEDTIVTGWVDVRLGKSYSPNEKHSIVDKIKLWFGYDIRKKQWKPVASVCVDRIRYGVVLGQAVVTLYRNGLGDEYATSADSHDMEDIPVPYAKYLLRDVLK